MTNIIESIQFKRGTKAKLEERLRAGDLGVPLRGEPIWETDTNKLKIGNGTDAYIDLEYFSGNVDDNLVLEGYYDSQSGFFYNLPPEEVDRQRLPEWSNKLYRDLATKKVYYFKAIGRFTELYSPAKLYSSSGQNTDGAMTQKAVTDGVDDIRFAVDGSDVECLVLNKPW